MHANLFNTQMKNKNCEIQEISPNSNDPNYPQEQLFATIFVLLHFYMASFHFPFNSTHNVNLHRFKKEGQ